MKKFEYEAILIKGPLNSVYAEFPFNVKEEFGTGKAMRVNVSLDGNFFKMSLMPRGYGKHWMLIRKEILLAIGKEEGDTVFITLEKNDSPQTIKIPDYLQWLFEDDPEMGKEFQKLSLFYKKFWIGSINEPKNEETKVERINKLFDFLRGNHSG